MHPARPEHPLVRTTRTTQQNAVLYEAYHEVGYQLRGMPGYPAPAPGSMLAIYRAYRDRMADGRFTLMPNAEWPGHYSYRAAIQSMAATAVRSAGRQPWDVRFGEALRAQEATETERAAKMRREEVTFAARGFALAHAVSPASSSLPTDWPQWLAPEYISDRSAQWERNKRVPPENANWDIPGLPTLNHGTY